MRTVFTLLVKEFMMFRRDRTDVVMTFITPVVLIFIFGHLFGVTKGSDDIFGVGRSARFPIALVNSSDSPVIARIIDTLKNDKSFRLVYNFTNPLGSEQPLDDDHARALIRENKLRFAVEFPPDAVSDDSFDLRVRFLNNPVDTAETAIVMGLLERAIYTAAPRALLESVPTRAARFVGPEQADRFYHTLANDVVATFGGNAAQIYERLKTGTWISIPGAEESASGDSKDFFSRLIKIESVQLVGREVINPMATRLVGGWAMMFLMFSVSASAKGLFDEKQAGLFLRLLTAPVHRTQILWSKYLYGMSLGLIQLTVMFIAGHFLYGINFTNHFGSFLLICLAASTACTAFGMMLAAISRTPEGANAMATFLILVMSALGGAWFPVSLFPDLYQNLSRLTLVFWSIDGFQRVLWAGAGFKEIIPNLTILFSTAAIITAFSLWRFRKGQIFE